MKKTPIKMFFFFLLALTMLGCPLIPEQDLVLIEDQSLLSISEISIDGTTLSSRGGLASERNASSTYELWIIPTERGVDSPLAPYNMGNIKRISMGDNGSFSVLPEDIISSTFVLVLMDVSTSPETAIGMIGLKTNDGTSILEFPHSSYWSNNLQMGTVSFLSSSDIGTSEITLEENPDVFSNSMLTLLQTQANFSNAYRMVLNMLRNVDRTNTSIYYTERAVVNFSRSSALTTEIVTDDRIIGDLTIDVFSEDGTTEAAFFDYNGDPFPDEVADYNNRGTSSANKWGFNISLGDFRSKIQPGQLWTLKSATDSTLAAFDFSASLVTDVANTPMFPFPQLIYETNGSNQITAIQFVWKYFDYNGNLRSITDLNLLNGLIGTTEFYVNLVTSGQTTSYMFRNDGEEGPSFSGDLTRATLDPPGDPDEGVVSLSYRFGLYAIRY